MGHKSIKNVMKCIIFEQRIFGGSEYDEFDMVYAENQEELFKYVSSYDPVDYYNMLMDRVHE